MNGLKKLLAIVLTIALILPFMLLSGCKAGELFNNGYQIASVTTPQISAGKTIPQVQPSTTSSIPQLAFAGDRNGKYALFVINIDGSGEKQITNWPDDDYEHPSWSPDGTILAAQRLHVWAREGTKWSIATINLNNGTLNDLSGEGTSGLSIGSPDFSPYGNLIICDGVNSLTTVNLGRVVGWVGISQQGKLGNNDMSLQNNGAGNPSVSPDASQIAFEATCVVKVIPPEPSPTPTISSALTTTQGVGLGGSGISRGVELTADSDTANTNPIAERGKRICVVDFEGTNLKQLTTSKEKYDDTYPTWSPDGKRIAFTSDRTGQNQIYVMNADGTGQTQITNDNFNNHDPAWSPDGAFIAYVSDHSGISELCIISPDGNGRTRINKVAEMVRTPAWRPISGQAPLGGMVPPTISTSTITSTVTTKLTVTDQSSTPVSTTGRLFISISGGNGPYDIYVDGYLVGEDSVTLTLLPGSYRITIYNHSGTKIKDETSYVIAGKQSVFNFSGVW